MDTTAPTNGNPPIRHTSFASACVAPRHVDVWLPPTYHASHEHYPVCYMHDGQNLFADADSGSGLSWAADAAMQRLIDGGITRGAIIVGIWHSTTRTQDYMPARPFHSFPTVERERIVAHMNGEPKSDAYLRFLVDELKPVIDATYRTQSDRANTFILGSSMGGLISLYALTEYPQVFGGAGCISTHWPIGGDLLVDALAAQLPPPGNHRIYFDYGDQELDAQYPPFQQRMDRHMQAAGYTHGHDWLTMPFPGTGHHERYWRDRVDLPLTFLLAGKGA